MTGGRSADLLQSDGDMCFQCGSTWTMSTLQRMWWRALFHVFSTLKMKSTHSNAIRNHIIFRSMLHGQSSKYTPLKDTYTIVYTYCSYYLLYQTIATYPSTLTGTATKQIARAHASTRKRSRRGLHGLLNLHHWLPHIIYTWIHREDWGLPIKHEIFTTRNPIIGMI